MKENTKTFIKNHIWSLMCIFVLLIVSLIIKFDICVLVACVFVACSIYSCFTMLVEDKTRKDEKEIKLKETYIPKSQGDIIWKDTGEILKY